MGPFQVGMDAAWETWPFPSRKRPNLLTSNTDLAIQRCSSRLLNISALSKRDAPNSTDENRPDMCDKKRLRDSSSSGDFTMSLNFFDGKGSRQTWLKKQSTSRSSVTTTLDAWIPCHPQIKPSFSSSSNLVLLQLPFQRGQQLYYTCMGQSMQTVKITPG